MTLKTKKTNDMSRAVGRRKSASARVQITLGKGKVTINSKDLKDYFSTKILQDLVLNPLKIVGKEKDLDISVKVLGGGIKGQAGAVAHGIARALVNWNEELKPLLKAEGLMTRDSRTKERKKPGLHKARRAHQWRKR
ncbi:MAG: 30S ribosomal protein S9 [Patescibacteria group bacterium]